MGIDIHFGGDLSPEIYAAVETVRKAEALAAKISQADYLPASSGLSPDKLVEVLKSPQSDDKTIVDAALSLCKLGEEAIPSLLHCLPKYTDGKRCTGRENSFKVRRLASEILGLIGKSAIPDLIESLSTERADGASEALVKIGNPAIPHLIAALGKSKPIVSEKGTELYYPYRDSRDYAAVTLMEIAQRGAKVEAAIPDLYKAAMETLPNFANPYLDALSAIGEKALCFAARGINADDPTKVKGILHAIGKMAYGYSDPKIRENLIGSEIYKNLIEIIVKKIANNQNCSVRINAAYAFGIIAFCAPDSMVKDLAKRHEKTLRDILAKLFLDYQKGNQAAAIHDDVIRDNIDLMRAIISCLGRVMSQDSVPLLTEISQSNPDSDPMQEASKALRDFRSNCLTSRTERWR